MEESQKCPQCFNYLFVDRQKSMTYCTNRSCKGLIVDFERITYDQEVNLHENDDQSKKQTRFGGYENKKEAFKNKLAELLNKKDPKERDRYYKKFDAGEHLISKLSGYINLKENDAFVKDVHVKYRELLYSNAEKLQQANYNAVALVAFILILREKQKKEKDNKKLNKVNEETLRQWSQLPEQAVLKVTQALELNQEKQYSKDSHIKELSIKAADLKFDELEIEMIKKFAENLLTSNLIKGERPQTIDSVILYCISQLSSNSEQNSKQIDQFAVYNGVTKDTVKKMWNSLYDKLNKVVPEWSGRRNINELHQIH